MLDRAVESAGEEGREGEGEQVRDCARREGVSGKICWIRIDEINSALGKEERGGGEGGDATMGGEGTGKLRGRNWE